MRVPRPGLAALATWTWDPAVVAILLITLAVYASGWWRGRRHGDRAASVLALTAWLGALSAFAAAAMSGAALFDDLLFSVHMLQHLLLAFVAAPLLVVARPLHCARWLLRHAGWQPHRRPRRGARRLLRLEMRYARPAVAFVVATVALWVWHVPALYDAALGSDAVHGAQHVSFLAAGLLYWWPLSRFAPRSVRLTTNVGRVLYLALGAMQSGLLGALIAFSPRPWYVPYLRDGASEQLVTGDQQLGGVLMLLPTIVVFVVGAVFAIRSEDAEPAQSRIGHARETPPRAAREAWRQETA